MEHLADIMRDLICNPLIPFSPFVDHLSPLYLVLLLHLHCVFLPALPSDRDFPFPSSSVSPLLSPVTDDLQLYRNMTLKRPAAGLSIRFPGERYSSKNT